MKKNEFIKIIRMVVREELKKTLPKMIAEEVKKSVPVRRVKSKKTVSTSLLADHKSHGVEMEDVVADQFTEHPRYAKDDMINNLLVETARSGEWRNMGGDTHDQPNIMDMVGQPSVAGSQVVQSDGVATQLAVPDGIHPAAVPEFLLKAFNKDYRPLVNKVKEKRGEK